MNDTGERTDAIIGWDIGGAHLKAAWIDGEGRVILVRQVPCRLWEGLDRLAAAFDAILDGGPPAGQHAVTMTGELVDLFPDRAHGVRALIRTAAARLAGSVLVWAGAAGFLPPDVAAGRPDLVASANWSATAALVGLHHPAALVADIGSTTTDLVPVLDGMVAARGHTDRDRLIAGELVYTGLTRTPLMAVADRLPWNGVLVPVMAEHFATTADVYRLLGTLPEEADQHPAADGADKSVAASARRIGRLIGVDWEPAAAPAWRLLAAALAEAQLQTITRAAALVLSAAVLPETAPVVGAGVGRFLAADLACRLHRPYLDLATLVAVAPAAADAAARCAPAVAVALLGR